MHKAVTVDEVQVILNGGINDQIVSEITNSINSALTDLSWLKENVDRLSGPDGYEFNFDYDLTAAERSVIHRVYSEAGWQPFIYRYPGAPNFTIILHSDMEF